MFTNLVSADQVERDATVQYARMLEKARGLNALGSADHPKCVVCAIAQRIIPYTAAWNPRARDWRWEVNLIGSNQINAFACRAARSPSTRGFPANAAAVRRRGWPWSWAMKSPTRCVNTRVSAWARNAATGVGAGLISQLLGFRATGPDCHELRRPTADAGVQPRRRVRGRPGGHGAGRPCRVRPRAGVTCMAKMGAANKGAPPQWLSTHPSGKTRIATSRPTCPR